MKAWEYNITRKDTTGLDCYRNVKKSFGYERYLHIANFQ